MTADQRVSFECFRDIARDHLEKLKNHEDKHEAKAEQIGRQREEHAASESKILMSSLLSQRIAE